MQSRIFFGIMQYSTKRSPAKEIARQVRERQRRAKKIKSEIKKEQKVADIEKLRWELDLLSIKGSFNGVAKSIESVERGRRPTREAETIRRFQRSAAPSPPSRRGSLVRQPSKTRRRSRSNNASMELKNKDK